MNFEFATAARIIFGRGSVGQATEAAAEMGGRAFVVTGRHPDRAGSFVELLKERKIECETFGIPGEPTTTIVIQAVESAKAAGSDMVISIGGGSAVDAGKAIAALLTNPGVPTDYLEVVGLGKPVTEKPLPHIAIPTTSGTGAEVTRNAVLAVPEQKVKVSMRSPMMLPSVAIVDPELTYSMPPEVTAATGLDALTQLAEAYTSNKANPLTDGICCEGLQRAGRSLLAAYQDGSNADAREDMAIASLFGGLALANAKLGAVHGFAGPLGGMLGAPHGVICATLLPHVMQANIRALQQREPDSPALARYDRVAALLTGNAGATADEGLEWLQNLCSALRTPALREFGLEETRYGEAVEKAQKSSSMKGNPIALTDGELTDILTKAGK
ncbi:MAG: iron-containing alcohol dehydrogenase [Planctomycetota bacterium]|jgi:alcohol dehydrogenase class IV